MRKALSFIAKYIPVLVIALVVLELLWSNTLVGSGKEVGSIDQKIERVRMKNEELAQEVASASSLMTIATKAKILGFVEPIKAQFVMIGQDLLPVAFNRPQ